MLKFTFENIVHLLNKKSIRQRLRYQIELQKSKKENYLIKSNKDISLKNEEKFT